MTEKLFTGTLNKNKKKKKKKESLLQTKYRHGKQSYINNIHWIFCNTGFSGLIHSQFHSASKLFRISFAIQVTWHFAGLGKCRHLRVKSMPLAFTAIFQNNPEYSGITWHFRKNNS